MTDGPAGSEMCACARVSLAKGFHAGVTTICPRVSSASSPRYLPAFTAYTEVLGMRVISRPDPSLTQSHSGRWLGERRLSTPPGMVPGAGDFNGLVLFAQLLSLYFILNRHVGKTCSMLLIGHVF